MSRRADTPRDLLFGLLALQTGLIDQNALVLAFHAWTRAEGRAMADLLVEQGAFDDDRRSLLEGLAAHHLKKHGDPETSLAALAIDQSTRRRLAETSDPKLLDSLATVGVTPSTYDDATPSRIIGTSTSGGQRFRVLRPHAKGGLGEVFIALDAELNREVALKEIQDRHDHPASRTKFLVEAEITGGLEHPGIVPVYGLGHHDDGRPYYAMRFIKGDNLKEAIERFHSDKALKADPGARSLALRKLLRRFLDVCNAIEYAHSRGVLHRDIKPGNVIVGKHGETLVVDWGLAKAQGKSRGPKDADEPTLVPPSASGSAETLPGQALGTPAFMSPEQAAGDLDRLGPHSDIYSLGATLYALLTGRSPFEGTLNKVLHDVQEGRFPRPRSLDPSIDPALEALCLKAMARSPEDRYASPRALADDLDRWSADEPIIAWKEPLSRRIRRWARRNRTAVTAAAASLLVALVGLASILAVQAKANADLNIAYLNLFKANEGERRANEDLKAANGRVESKNKELLEANARESKINTDLRLANEQVKVQFDLAQESIRSYSKAVNEEEMLKEERLRPLRDKLLRSAAEFHGKLGQILQGRTDRASRVAFGKALFELGDLTRTIGDQKAALEVHQKALATRRKLATEAKPDLIEPQADLAYSLHDVGFLFHRMGDPTRALEAYTQALAIRRSLAEANPADTKFQSDLALSYNNIGYLLESSGDPARALVSYNQSLAIRRGLAEANPSDTQLQSDLATSHNNIGMLRDRLGEPAKALESCGQSLAILRRLAEANPTVARFQADQARSHNNIGSLLGRLGEPAKALESYNLAVAILRRLAELHPAFTELQADLATAHANIGALLESTGDLARSLESHNQSLAIFRRLTETHPAVTRYQSDLATAHNNLGVLFGRIDDPARALESHTQALAIRRRLAEANPTIPGHQGNLRNSLVSVGFANDRSGRAAEAVASLRQGITIGERLARDPTGLFNLARYQSRLAGVASKPGSGLSTEESRAEADRAMAMLRRAVSAGFRNVRALRSHKDFDPIRSRADFQELLTDLAFPGDRPFAP